MTVLPKKVTKNCYKCNKHTVCNVKEVKKGKSTNLSWINRQKIRRGNTGNLGKYSKPPMKKIKKAKRPNLVLECTVCLLKRSYSRKRCIKFNIK